MKNSFKLNLLLCLILLVAKLNTSAQSSEILGKFSASETSRSVYLNWSIFAGSTCNGIQIQRSIDSINFVQIGNIPGICGSTTYVQSYDFTDDNPVKNKINYYQLTLGNTGVSEILSVDVINIQNRGYQIRPNPVTNHAKIYFANERKEEHQFTLFNQWGAQLFSLKTVQEYFDLDASSLSSNVYLFAITDSQNATIAKGKLVVQH